MNLPKKITIGCTEIEIKTVHNIINAEVLGQCCLSKGEILIADTADGVEQCISSKLNTFFHEMTHCILDTMGEKELSSNEKFVCTFSSLLAQALTTMEE